MYISNYDYSTTKFVENKQIIVRLNPLLDDMIEDILNYVNDGEIENKEWQHNIHHEIVYNYKPFNSDGYTLIYTIKFDNECYIDWFEFILNKQLDDKRNLELTFENSIQDNEEVSDKNE